LAADLRSSAEGTAAAIAGASLRLCAAAGVGVSICESQTTLTTTKRAAAAALTVYDMAKALDRGMEIRTIRLLEKSGGKSGHFKMREQKRKRKR